jgi:hypothetical protein
MPLRDDMLAKLHEAAVNLAGLARRVGTGDHSTRWLEAVSAVEDAARAFGASTSADTPTYGLFIEMSTGNLTEETRALLELTPPAHWPVPGMAGEYGWFVSAPEQNPGGAVPDDLWQVLCYARERGVYYVLFDRDAEPDPNLPYYDD